MRNFKGIILTKHPNSPLLRHFLKTLSMIHMPPKPIASAGSDISIVFM